MKRNRAIPARCFICFKRFRSRYTAAPGLCRTENARLHPRAGTAYHSAIACLSIVAQAHAAEGGEQPSLFTGDLGNILWTLLTFVAVLVVLGKFAWRPLLGALQKREDFIRNSLEEAKKQREEAQAQLAQYTQRVEAARAEASAIVEEGRRDAEALRRTIEEDARREAEAMLARAKREISLATDTAVKHLYTVAADLGTSVASRLIRKELDPKAHERLVEEAIDELESVRADRWEEG